MFERAFETTDIVEFINYVFPPEWGGIGARILESGAEFSEAVIPWAPRWSKIPMTIRYGKDNQETYIKSIMYRLHDCLHQLWGLPIPSRDFTEDEFYLFKRAGMCGEVAVLAITEFEFGKYLFDTLPDQYKGVIFRRNAIPLTMFNRELYNKSLLQIAMRLDGLLHKKIRPRWVREDKHATAFCDDYVPMLEEDRAFLDLHWESMKNCDWIPEEAPNSRYSPNLDGLELTTWMIQDFEHLKETDTNVDWALREFNKERRSKIVLPRGW